MILSLCACFCILFYSLISSTRLIFYYSRISFSSNYFWWRSLAFNSFSAFSFAISVNFLALFSSNTNLLILASNAYAFIAPSFYKYFASSISIPSLIAFLAGWPSDFYIGTTLIDLAVPPKVPLVGFFYNLYALPTYMALGELYFLCFLSIFGKELPLLDALS